MSQIPMQAPPIFDKIEQNINVDAFKASPVSENAKPDRDYTLRKDLQGHDTE